MKQQEYFLIHLLSFTIVLIAISILGVSYSPRIENIESIIQEQVENIEKNTIEEINPVNKIKYNNNNLYYGGKDNYPYLIVLNNQNQITNNLEYKKENGTFSNIDYNGIYLNTTITNDQESKKLDLFISNDKLIPFHKKQLTFNYSKGKTIKPKYLVIHETANTRNGADASAHYRYWSTNNNANASTHFVVDSNEIYQMLELNQMAWHVGDNKGYSDIQNTNSIGIELCVNEDGDYMLAREHTINLTIAIMKSLNMGIEQLKKHQDASGKFDPIIMLNNNLWDDFVNQVKIGLNS